MRQRARALGTLPVATKLSIGDQGMYWRGEKTTKAQWAERWVGPAMVLGFEGNSVWINAKNRTLKCAARHIRHATPDEMLPWYEIFDEAYAADSVKPAITNVSEDHPDGPAGPPPPTAADTEGKPMDVADDDHGKPEDVPESHYMDFTTGRVHKSAKAAPSTAAAPSAAKQPRMTGGRLEFTSIPPGARARTPKPTAKPAAKSGPIRGRQPSPRASPCGGQPRRTPPSAQLALPAPPPGPSPKLTRGRSETPRPRALEQLRGSLHGVRAAPSPVAFNIATPATSPPAREHRMVPHSLSPPPAVVTSPLGDPMADAGDTPSPHVSFGPDSAEKEQDEVLHELFNSQPPRHHPGASSDAQRSAVDDVPLQVRATLASARGLDKSDFSSSVDVGEGSHVHAGPLWRKGENLEKDVGSKSFVVKFLVKKVEIYKFD